MATDILVLGGVVFDDFSTPAHMPFGGDQMMIVHRLPGGQRVIDTLGPDDMDISWVGRLWGQNAYTTALFLDSMRSAGLPLPLTFAGRSYLVVIERFTAAIERFPQDIEYVISCVTTGQNVGGINGVLGGAALAAADIGAAAAL